MTAGVIFRSRLQSRTTTFLVDEILAELCELASEGWHLSPHLAAGREDDPWTPRVYWSSAFRNIDLFGIFEAPSLAGAFEGVSRLRLRGWDVLFETTEWLIGPRDLPPDLGEGPHNGGLGFLALWDWNDAWHKAAPEERARYDAECDVAFTYDVTLGIDLFGRFACGALGGWDHAALWEVPNLDVLTTAMGAHETQADFMFTTSSHFIGRPIPLSQLKERFQ